MNTIVEKITEQLQNAFAECGYDRKYAKASLSNRPDLCEYQCNGAMAAAKEYKKAPFMIADEVVAKLDKNPLFDRIESVKPGFINIILALVSAFYILLDRETLVKGIKKLNYSLFDKNFANYLTLWTNDAKTVFEQYIVGNIIDSFIVGVICYFGALVFKLPYASMIALIIGVTNVIPVFGPFLGAIPVIIILCLIDPFSALIFTIFIFILQQCDGNIIKPIVLGDKLGMSGFWILFSVTVGGALFGVVGMFLGVPIFALIYAGVHDYIQVRLRNKKITINDKAGTID